MVDTSKDKAIDSGELRLLAIRMWPKVDDKQYAELFWKVVFPTLGEDHWSSIWALSLLEAFKEERGMFGTGLSASAVMTQFGTNAQDTNAFLMMAAAMREQKGVPIAAFAHNEWFSTQLERVL